MLEIPGYDILEQIGHGGMAEVYRARHKRLDRHVALKVLHAHYSDDTSFAERFIREARIAANLNHPNIVQIFDVNRADETLFLAMEYVSGGDLTHNFHPPINQRMLLNLIDQLCSALDFAHQKGYIHRDIKPANILFRDNGSLALTDFGIARTIHSDSSMTQTGTVIGTPSYMSPEQAQGLKLTSQSDLYSAAVIVYQYVTGELPFQADSSITIAIKHISDPVPTLPDELRPLQNFFDRALAKLPTDRFDTGEALYKHLQSTIAKLPVSPPKEDTFMVVLANEDQDSADSVSTANKALHSFKGKHGRDHADQQSHASKVIKADPGLWGSPTNPLTQTMRYIFIQVNKLVVNVFPSSTPDYKKVLVIAAGLLAGLGLAYFIVSILLPFDNLSEQERLRVAQLLVAADQNFKRGELMTPPTNNAMEKYQQVLALAPNDRFAISGISNIANTIAQQANTAIIARNTTVASERIANLRSVLPDHESLEDLTQRLSAIQRSIREEQTQKLQIAGHLIKQNQYEKALNVYKGLAQKYPQHAETATAINNLTQSLLGQIEAYIQSKQFSRATSLLGLSRTAATLTKDTVTMAKVAGVAKTLDRQKMSADRQNKIERLLFRANQAMKSYHMDTPRQGSANELFDQVLRLSPNNRQAIAGKASIISWLENSIVRSSEKGDISKAKAYLARLGALQNRHPRLKQLRNTIAVAEKSAARKQAIDDKVADLYRRADIYLERDKTKSADKIHRKIKSLAPSDRRLQALGLRIADGYAVLAQRELDASDWRDAEVWVSRGLAHAPHHRTLRRQRAEAAKALQEK